MIGILLSGWLRKKQWVYFFAAFIFAITASARPSLPSDTILVADLPREAQHTLILIKRGGPFPHSKDGAVFGNYEGLLPKQKRGYYHEFTVETPGAHDRGARRIVTGGDLSSPREFYYTDNHYASFKRIKE